MEHSNNPLRSEAAMFRVVVIAVIAAAPIIALGLLAGPGWGAVALGVEVGIAIGLLWRRLRERRGSRRVRDDEPAV